MTTTRLYHSLRSFYLFFPRHKKTTLSLVAIFILFLWVSPLLKYAPQGASIAKGFLFSEKNLRLHEDNVNILVLGLGGPKNEPSGLTDTIIFSSFNLKAEDGKSSLLLSLPRDIWSPSLQAKINTAYYYGNRTDGLGMKWAADTISEIVGQPISYTVVVSFDGFVKIIDLLGGVDVLVERSFIDKNYPISGKEDDTCGGDRNLGCRYETLSFDEGQQHFDGKLALKFARSRNAEGLEGTDFARAVRQQKVIVALKDKLFAPTFLLNPIKLDQMIKLIGQSLETDIPESHLGGLARIALNARGGDLRSEVLGAIGVEGATDGFLEHPPISRKYGNQWVLTPRVDSWQPLQGWVVCLLGGEICPIGDFTKEINDQYNRNEAI
ncbi:MAG: LCP family protein [bacterium]|nr:LCP family protein [bacterium]